MGFHVRTWAMTQFVWFLALFELFAGNGLTSWMCFCALIVHYI